MSGVTRFGATIVASLLLVAGCADDGGEPIAVPSTTEDSLVATTVESASTTAAPTTTEATTTTTTEPGPTTTVTTEPREVPYWTVECSEVAGDGGASYAFDPTLREFTTLGAEPMLDLVLPEVVTSAGPWAPIASTRAIPGGVVVGVYPPNGWPTADEFLESSSLVAVGDDGAIRWRRCFDELVTGTFLVAPAELGPATAWVFSQAWNRPLEVVGVDLATGAGVPFPSDVTGLDLRGQGDRFAVLGVAGSEAVIDPGSRLLVVDLLDGSTEEISYPPEAYGTDPYQWFAVYDADPLDDEYVLALGSLYPGDVRSVAVDGSWTADHDVWRSVLPTAVTETFGEPFELRLLDGGGDVIWAAPDFHGISREGFRSAIAEDVVVAVRCAEWDAAGVCTWVDDEPPAEELAAYDLESGAELWTTPGARALVAVAGNTALATARAGEFGLSAAGYVLLDLTTGVAVPGTTWPSGAFAEGCCGEDEVVHVNRTGGIVIATNGDHVRVWYPPELTTSTTVDLMS